MALDGFTQMLTDYESTSFMRLVTGTPFGLFLGLIMSCSFAARPKFFETDAGKVVLPSGTKFSMVDDSEE